MKVFISWSGEPSKSIAGALYHWLPNVIQEADPFFSDDSIEAGSDWLAKIGDELKGSLGILCLAPNNLQSTFLHYEAGALSKSLDDAKVRVIPLLYQLDFPDVAAPLSRFNMTKLDRPGVWKVVKALNEAADRPLEPLRLENAFDVWWPQLEKSFDDFPKVTAEIAHRPDREILEELLAGVRSLLKSSTPRRTATPDFSMTYDRYIQEQLNAGQLNIGDTFSFIDEAGTSHTVPLVGIGNEAARVRAAQRRLMQRKQALDNASSAAIEAEYAAAAAAAAYEAARQNETEEQDEDPPTPSA